MENLLVIDIGSHKAEEISLFEGRPRWTRRNYLRMFREHRHGALREIATINALSRRFQTLFRCRYVLVEPIMHTALLNFIETTPAFLFAGVTSCGDSGPSTLLLANDSLGHSIIPSKPGLSGQARGTFNISFPALYNFAVSTFVRSGDCRRIVVRMNAEGVEADIIDFLAKEASTKPNLIAGSIGDIRKCFGQAAFDEAERVMRQASIPFVHLTSHPRYWASGLLAIMHSLESEIPRPASAVRKPVRPPDAATSES